MPIIYLCTDNLKSLNEKALIWIVPHLLVESVNPLLCMNRWLIQSANMSDNILHCLSVTHRSNCSSRATNAPKQPEYGPMRDERPWNGQPPPGAWYQFTIDRKGLHPVNHLSDYKGWVRADGYSGSRDYSATKKLQKLLAWHISGGSS